MSSKFYRKAEGSFLDDTDYVEVTSDGVVFLNTEKKRRQAYTVSIALFAQDYVDEGTWKEIQVSRYRHVDGGFYDGTDFVEVIDNQVFTVDHAGNRKLCDPDGVTISDVEYFIENGSWLEI